MKKSIHYLLLIVLVSTTAFAGYAQDMLTLAECKKRALQHNQNIKLAQADHSISEQNLELSKKNRLPQLDLEASYLYRQDPLVMDVPGYELPTITGQPSGVYSPPSLSNLQYNNTYNANLKVNLPLYMGGKLQNAKHISDYALQISDMSVRLNETEVLFNIETQYWSLVSLLEQKSVIETSIEFLKDVKKEVTSRYHTGMITKNEVLKVEVELNNVQLSLIRINNHIELAQMNLNQAMGYEANNSFVLADSTLHTLYQDSLSAFNPNKLQQRLEINIIEKQILIGESQKKMVKSDYLPQVVSFAQYGYQNPNHLSQDEGELTLTAGLSLKLPLYHWGEKKSKVVKADMQNYKNELRLDQAKEYLTLEMNQAVFNLNESMVHVRFTKASLAQANENLKLETNRLNEGLTTTTDLMNAQLQWQKSQADHISAKASAKINEAFYLKSIGMLNTQ